MSDNSKKIAYAVLSCDPYSDIWDCYGQLFQRFWPDCPYDYYMASNHKSFDKYGFTPILLGDDISWSHGLLTLINVLGSKGYEYAMIAFDDLLIVKKVDTSFVASAINMFVEEKGQCLRFNAQRCSRCYKHNEIYGRLGEKVPYRVVLGFTLWNLQSLKSLVVEGESAWQFEKNATERSFDLKDFYCTWRNPFEVLNLIVKRKIDIKEFEKLKKLIPDASFDREQVFVKNEKFKGVFLLAFLKYFPRRYQYSAYKLFTKPINI